MYYYLYITEFVRFAPSPACQTEDPDLWSARYWVNTTKTTEWRLWHLLLFWLCDKHHVKAVFSSQGWKHGKN